MPVVHVSGGERGYNNNSFYSLIYFYPHSPLFLPFLSSASSSVSFSPSLGEYTKCPIGVEMSKHNFELKKQLKIKFRKNYLKCK